MRRRGLILFIVYDDDGVLRRQCSLDWGDGRRCARGTGKESLQA
jgi:hypothetical protein